MEPEEGQVGSSGQTDHCVRCVHGQVQAQEGDPPLSTPLLPSTALPLIFYFLSRILLLPPILTSHSFFLPPFLPLTPLLLPLLSGVLSNMLQAVPSRRSDRGGTGTASSPSCSLPRSFPFALSIPIASTFLSPSCSCPVSLALLFLSLSLFLHQCHAIVIHPPPHIVPTSLPLFYRSCLDRCASLPVPVQTTEQRTLDLVLQALLMSIFSRLTQLLGIVPSKRPQQARPPQVGRG